MQRTRTLQPRLAAQTRSSGPHHERVANPRCTAVASCSIGGCDPPSVITASIFSRAMHVVSCVRCLTRLARAAKKKRIWIFGNVVKMVTMPDFGFDGLSSSHAEFISIYFFPDFFFQLFFLYYVRNPGTRQDRQHTSSAGCMLQPAGNNAIQACRLP